MIPSVTFTIASVKPKNEKLVNNIIDYNWMFERSGIPVWLVLNLEYEHFFHKTEKVRRNCV